MIIFRREKVTIVRVPRVSYLFLKPTEFHITVPTLGSHKINTNILSVTLPSRGFQTMAAVPSEVSSIVIAPTAPHRSLLELHYKPSPSEARTIPRSQRCESQVQKDECLVPILLETTPLDGQAEIDTGDPPSASGITLDHIQQATAIDVTCSISEETPVTGEPSYPTVLLQTNGRHVQVENTSRLPALRDTVHCTTTLTQCSHSLCECRPWTTPKTLPTELALRDRSSNELDVEDRLAQMRHQVLKDRSGRIYVPLQANTSPLVSNTKPLPLMPIVLDFIESKRRVFLLLGDSGSGKSTFCWQLVRTLWDNYTKGSRIPILVDLRDIDRLSDDLIESHLQEYGFSDTDVRELIHGRQFVLVCDGYDESRLSTSIYTKRLGQLGVKMIVSCRNAFLGWDYQGRFYPLGDNRYHGECSELFDEAIITPFQKTDIQEFIKQYVVELPTQEPSDNPSAPSFDDYWEKLSIIPNMMGLVSNPFLLTLALRALPSLSIDFQDLTNNNATRLQLYDGFVEEWIRINIARLQQSNLNQDYRTVFDSLLNDGFAWCVKDFSKRLAEAMHEHQKGRLVVNFRYRRTNSWKTEFFGDKIESTLLRESSLLSRAGFRHWFIHKSLFDYFRSLVLYDPDESDDDESDNDESDDNDSNDGWGDPHDGGGNPFSDGGDGRCGDGGDFNGGDGILSGGNVISTSNSGRSAGGGGGGPSSSSSGSTGAISDSPGGNGGSSGSNGGSAESNGGSPGDNSAPMGGSDGSGGKDGPSGNGDSPHQGKDSYRSRRKASKKKSRPSSDPFSTQNLLGDPELLEFLVERTQSDSRLKKRLLLAIEQSKALPVPSLAAANAITILLKSGIQFQDADLDSVLIPSDYISTAMGSTEPVQLPESNLTGRNLMKVLMTPNIPASTITVPTRALTVPVSPSTGPAPTPHSTAIAQMAPTASLKPSRSDEKNIPLRIRQNNRPLVQFDFLTTGSNSANSTVHTKRRDRIHKIFGLSKSKTNQANLKNSNQSPHSQPLSQQSTRPSSVLSQASNLPSGVKWSTTSGTVQEKALSTPLSEAHVFETIFAENVFRFTMKTKLPQGQQRIETMQQLVYCNALLLWDAFSPPKYATGEAAEHGGSFVLQKSALDKTELDWLETTKKDPMETDRLRRLATRMVEQFIADASKDSDKIAEIVILGPILEKEPYRNLLATFIMECDDFRVLDVDILQGLIQLVQGVSPGYLVADDLIELFGILRGRLNGTYQLWTEDSYHLTLAVSRILDFMADHKVQDLDRVLEHEPLSAVLSGLKNSSDPYLMYQACYAFQALQYVPDNESALQAVLRLSNGVVDSLFKVTAVLKLDMASVLKGLGTLQEALEGAISADGNALEGVFSLMESGRGVLDSQKEGLGSGRKEPWYPAVRAAYAFVQAGQLKDLKQLIFEAPCRRDPLFQWGICQLLGEIAVDTVWDVSARQQSIFLLGHLRQHDLDWGQDESVKAWMLTIITKLCTLSDQVISETAHSVLQDLTMDQSALFIYPYPLRARLPVPSASPLLTIHYLEYDLENFRLQRIQEATMPVYISPMAKASLKAQDNDVFPLMERMQEFLAGDRQVMLILGDPGAGKSTFNKHLEHRLWIEYKHVGPIPLFINLPAIKRPDTDLIAKHLRANNFSGDQIKEIKQHRQLILICDGYDESQQLVNLYRSNMLNQPGQWKTKMVISCRTQFLGPIYIDRFRPQSTNRYAAGSQDLFQEAVIAPFSKDQIESYIGRYVPLEPRAWTTKDYMDKLTAIPNLMDLAKNPLLLSLALETLYGFIEGKQDLSATSITRAQLYDTFVEHWSNVNEQRLQGCALTKTDRAVLNQLLDRGFVSESMDYSTRLALAIFEKQDGNPVVRYVHHYDMNTWKAQFFGMDPKAQLLRISSPLTRSGNLHRFLDRSMLEYFFSRAIFHPSSHGGDDESTPQTNHTLTESQLINIDGPLFTMNLLSEPSVIHFLSDRVKQVTWFKQHLLELIDLSKSDDRASQAAANAITILARAGVHFHSADLRGIRIAGADLSDGQFDSVQLQGADLRDVNFSRSWLRQVDFSDAQMDGA
ncbi:hypothetical protein K457DRAFT_1825144 [Linnemannia elongata AG-77]|uniref:Uncharacterized protein n=1 Tax=Linnemannia elongata AG-77 TaxID=1314771 RepID=A0A197JEK3_9FUNG|nr:hypothetical protein K457DRAFT_1825144 [Linnemannia elongata AG-77]